MIIGWMQFGRSAWKSIRAGVPNMDVLVTIGSTAAYGYSMAEMTMSASGHNGNLYFETAASIITLILVGNLIEQRAVKKTTSAIHALRSLQPEKATQIISRDGKDYFEEVSVNDLSIDDKLLIREGDKVPADGIITEGIASLDEALMTGEAIAVSKAVGDTVIGGTVLLSGTISIKVTSRTNQSTLAKIIELVKNAQHDRPKIQRLGDRISAILFL
jgi:Cu+-exporting ATPase